MDRTVYNNPAIWHFRFNGPTPEALVQGRERTYFEHFRAGWAYFVSFPQAAKDFAELSRTRLTMAELTIGGDKANGDLMGRQAKRVASTVTMVVLKDTGHWVLEERPRETMEALSAFL